MSEIINIGDLQVRRGEKKTGYLEVGETAVSKVRIPLAIVNGINSGPTLCITGGVHGSEYSGIEAVIRIFRQTEPAKLSGTLLTVPVYNMAALETRGPQGGMGTPHHYPMDSLNPNRVFPGNPEGSMSYQLAAAFMSQIMAKADYCIDCHGGDLNEDIAPFALIVETGKLETDMVAKEVLAASFDCYILLSMHSGGIIDAASKLGKPTIVVEAGGYGRLSEDATKFLTNGIVNVMRRLKMLEGTPTPNERPKIRDRPSVYVKRGGLLYTPPIGTRIKKGECVGEVRNIFGELLETLQSPVNGVIIWRRSPFPVAKNDRAVAIVSDDDTRPDEERYTLTKLV